MRVTRRRDHRIAPASPWDEFFRESNAFARKHEAYAAACHLDANGNHSGADRVLRDAGVEEREIKMRREHIEWRMKQGLPAIEGA